MAETVADLILRITADASELKEKLQQSGADTKKFTSDIQKDSSQMASTTGSNLASIGEKSKVAAKSFEHFGSNLRVVSRNLTFLGAAMVGPIAAAFKASEKSSSAVALTIGRLGDAAKTFSSEVAKAAIPVANQLAATIEKLVNWFKNLPDETKKAWVEWTAKGGAVVLALGTILHVVHALEKVRSIATNPILITIAVGFAAWKIAEWWESGPRQKFEEWVTRLKAKINDEWTNLWKPGPVFGKTGNTPWPAIDIGAIFVSGKGSSKSGGAPKTENQFSNEFSNQFELGMKEALRKYSDFSRTIVDMVNKTADAMNQGFSNFFFDAFTNQLKSAKEYFADFGRTILKMIADMIAQMITFYLLGQIMGIFGFKISGGGFGGGPISFPKHEGGMIGFGGFLRKAHEGLAPGEVPVIAQAGEGFLSRNGMATLGAKGLDALNSGGGVGGQNITLIQHIQSWDTSDFIRNKKMIGAAMIDELQRNGSFRGAIRKYS